MGRGVASKIVAESGRATDAKVDAGHEQEVHGELDEDLDRRGVELEREAERRARSDAGLLVPDHEAADAEVRGERDLAAVDQLGQEIEKLEVEVIVLVMEDVEAERGVERGV